MARGTDDPGNRMGKRSASRSYTDLTNQIAYALDDTRFDDHRSRPQLKHLTDERNIRMVQNLRAMRQGTCPQLGSRLQHPDLLALARDPGGAEGLPDDLIVGEPAEAVVENPSGLKGGARQVFWILKRM